jgi:hypothetical protein
MNVLEKNFFSTINPIFMGPNLFIYLKDLFQYLHVIILLFIFLYLFYKLN